MGGLAGAGVGEIGTHISDYGVSKDLEKSVEKGLGPNSSRLIVYMEPPGADQQEAALARDGAVINREGITKDVGESGARPLFDN